MADDGQVKYVFLGDADQLKKVIGGVDKDLDKVEKKTKSTSDKMQDSWSKVVPVVGAAAAGVAVLGVALKAAVEDEASQKTLAETLRNVAGATTEQVAATEKWIDTTQRATGVADDELRPALALLTRETGNVTSAQGLLKLAMDVSQGTGKDLSTVAAAMTKILEGNTGAASKLVPELTGIAREGASADEMMAALAATFGGQTAANAETAQGKMARLNVAFDEMKESLGEKLLPIFMQFTDWLIDKAIPKTEEIAGKIDAWWQKQDGLRSAMEKAGEIVVALTQDVIAIVGWIQKAVEVTDAFAKSLNSLPDKIFGIESGFNNDLLTEEQLRARGVDQGTIDRLKKSGKVAAKAMGGPVSGGTPYLVGERGPELFVPGGSGSIVPNSSMGGNTIVINTGADPQAVINAIKQYERRNGTAWRN